MTAVLVILTGIVGTVFVTPLMNAMKVQDDRTRGFAVGIATLGIGTERAFLVSEISGAFAGIGRLSSPNVVALFSEPARNG